MTEAASESARRAGADRRAEADPAGSRPAAAGTAAARSEKAAERAAERAARRAARREEAEAAKADAAPAAAEQAEAPAPAPAPTLGELLAKLPPLPRPTLPRLPRLRKPRLRLLPAMIFAGAVMMGVRVGDVWTGLAGGQGGLDLVEPTAAQAAGEAEAPEADRPVRARAEAAPSRRQVASTGDAAEAVPEADAGEAGATASGATGEEEGGLSMGPGEMTASELELLQNLSDRREALEARERDLNQREALLAVAERRIDQKMDELTTLRGQLEGLMGMVDEEQEAHLTRLVGIYESMRPSDAADIFNGLEMDVLIDVLQRMREQKSAPILAAMEPERARMVTAELVMRRDLPELPAE
jgi:flagellar motility protein MotE (MotC chaperone)